MCLLCFVEFLPLVVVAAVAGWQCEECVVNLFRGSIEDFALTILIVKLCRPVGSQPWFSTLNLASHVHVVCVIPLLTC